jgi:hypothetical protein
MEQNKKSKKGGFMQGSGRPKGSKNIYSFESVKKLDELGFDPITIMVEKYHEISAMIDSNEIRKGSGAHAQLIGIQQKIANDLMQYSYKKIPDKLEQEITEKKPIAIKLTTNTEENKE